MSKRDHILATAKSLFIEQGLRGTTISSIADKAGIAKGSVYSYFRSKQDIVKALLLDSTERSLAIAQQLIEQSDMTGESFLYQYVELELSQINEERVIQQVLLQDESLEMDSEMMEFIQTMRSRFHQIQQQVLVKAYGEKPQAWQLDVIVMLNGTLQEYGVYMTLDDANFSIEDCAKFIAFCLNTLIHALPKAKITPVLTAEKLPIITRQSTAHRLQQARQLSQQMIELIDELPMAAQALVKETCQLLIEELNKEQPSSALLRALIANLRPYDSFTAARRKLADWLDVELI